MKKTTQPDLPLILADYTEFVIQQERRRQQFRDAVAGSTEILNPERDWFAKWEATRPQGQFARWHISDRD